MNFVENFVTEYCWVGTGGRNKKSDIFIQRMWGYKKLLTEMLGQNEVNWVWLGDLYYL